MIECRAWTPSQQDVDRQYVNSMGCAPMEVSGVASVAEYSGSLSTCLSDQSCPAADYMTCWEKLKAMSDDSYNSEDSYDSYEEVDGRPECSDYDDPRDYEEWCAWNDVDEDEGYYVPFQSDVAGVFFPPRLCLK